MFLSLSPFACLLCWCCSRQDDITRSSVDCSVQKLSVHVCVRRQRPSREEHTDGPEESCSQRWFDFISVCFFNDCEWNQIECVCVCVKGRNKTMWGLNGNAESLEDRKQTPTVLKLCLRSNYKDQDLTKWLLELLHVKWISFCLFALYKRCCRMTCTMDCKPGNSFQSDLVLYNSNVENYDYFFIYSSHSSPPP